MANRHAVIIIAIGLACVVIVVGIVTACSNSSKSRTIMIRQLTDRWIKNVTEKNDPVAIAKMFCSDGNLVGTVSQEKRQGKDIEKYFDYFAKLPELTVVDKEYNISQIVPAVLVNTAFITWKWKGLAKPIVARMTFIFRNKCIFQLHSSALPELNADLKKVSGSS